MTDKPVLLVTGARKGIGRRLTEHYLKTGYRVIGCSRKPSDLSAPDYTHFCIDIADEPSVQRMFGDIRQRFRRLDGLLNNAGIAAMNSFVLTPVSQARQVLETNVIGCFLLCREAAKLMFDQTRGRIINFTTVAVPMNLEGEAVYVASKSAVEALTKVLARELAEARITVNAVGPAPIQTDLLRAVPPKKLDALVSRQALHRFCSFEDIANITDFYLHSKSDFITGQVLYLGGV